MVLETEILEDIEKKILHGMTDNDFAKFLKSQGKYLDLKQALDIISKLEASKKWSPLIQLLLFLEYYNQDALPKDYHAIDLTRDIIVFYDNPYSELICAKMLKENVNPFALYEFPKLTKYKESEDFKQLEIYAKELAA